MGVNKIGPYFFLRIDGPLARPLQRFVIEARAGVDGVAQFATGKRGDVQRITTRVDVLNEAFAWDLYYDYTGLIGSNVQIIRNSVSWPDTRYDILSVESRAVNNHLGAVGGLYGGATILVCQWDIIPRKIA